MMAQFNQKRKVKTVIVIVRSSKRSNQWICSSNLCWLGDFEKIICPCKEGRGDSGSHKGMQNVLSL